MSRFRYLCSSREPDSHRPGSSSDESLPERSNWPQFVSGWRGVVTMLFIFGLAALMQTLIANRSGLWVDEIFSLAIATGHSLEHPAAVADPTRGDFVEPAHPVSAEEFRRYLKHDNPPASPLRVVRAVLLSETNPPLYHLLLYGWTLVFGTSDMALRSFSIACSLICLSLLASVARRTIGASAVFPACILFVSSPPSIYYSTEGRMYSLLWLCVLAATWASLVLNERGGGVGLYALWIVASTAGFLTHYFFVFPWLAIVAWLSINPGKLTRLHLATCVLVTLMLILPWYLRLPESMAAWRITKDWIKWQPARFDRLLASRDIVLQFFWGRSYLWMDNPKSDNAALIFFGIIAVAMAWRLRIQIFCGKRLLLWLVFGATCAGPLAFDFVQHTYTVAVPRYAIAALPVAYLLTAVGLVCLSRRIRLVMLVLIALAWAPNVVSIYRNQSRNWQPFREISQAVSVNSSPTDLILVHSIPSGVLEIARYANGPAAIASWVGQLGTRHVPESIHQLAAGRTRILFVRVHEVREPAPEEEWLRANAVVFRQRRLATGRIVDFRPLNSKTF